MLRKPGEHDGRLCRGAAGTAVETPIQKNPAGVHTVLAVIRRPVDRGGSEERLEVTYLTWW